MKLNLILDDQVYELNAPDELVAQAGDFFAKMDRDMDAGWQMGREWVESPDRLQRCKIVANKLLTAVENEDDKLGRLMAGYIVSRAPEIESVEPDINGEPQQTLFTFRQEQAPVEEDFSPSFGVPANLNIDMEKFAQAGKEVSGVFKMGRQWRFSILNRSSGEWEESAAIGDQQQAEAMRESAIRVRYQELCEQS